MIALYRTGLEDPVRATELCRAPPVRGGAGIKIIWREDHLNELCQDRVQSVEQDQGGLVQVPFPGVCLLISSLASIAALLPSSSRRVALRAGVSHTKVHILLWHYSTTA